MTVGETLTEARSQAGLSVEELSERTRIRGTVIRSIERDDYQACGGDLYVRGYVRAIAGAVGIDAQPLIREYDEGRGGDQSERIPAVSPPGAAPTSFDLPAVTDDAPGDGAPADLGATRFDLPALLADPAATSFDLPRVPDVAPAAALPAAVPPAAHFPAAVSPATELPVAVPPATPPPAAAQPPGTAQTRFDIPAITDDLMAAGYDLPPAEPAQPGSATPITPAPDAGPAGPGEPPVPPVTAPSGTVPPVPAQPGTAQDGRWRGTRRGLVAVAAIVVVAAVALGVTLATAGTSTKNAGATTVPSQNAASADAKARAAAQASASAAAQASASARASASASAQAGREATAKAAAQRVTTLSVASVTAYGPDGFADGDNPGTAQYAVAGNAPLPWTSQWYVTPDFGMLKHGTGLLLDLGRTVTVTSVRLDLGQYQGSDLQIRVGNGAALADLRVAAQANAADGLVKLTLSQPTAARYLLIWFTQLPPDGTGHYQVSVSHVVVTGRR